MINPYDKAHELGRALKESTEYKEYIKAKEEIYSDPENKKILQEFKKQQYEIQMQTINGKEVESDRMDKIQQMYKILVDNPKIKEFFDIEVRFNILLTDINKIIGDSVKDAIMDN